MSRKISPIFRGHHKKIFLIQNFMVRKLVYISSKEAHPSAGKNLAVDGLFLNIKL